jgi:hypothetical protein
MPPPGVVLPYPQEEFPMKKLLAFAAIVLAKRFLRRR